MHKQMKRLEDFGGMAGGFVVYPSSTDGEKSDIVAFGGVKGKSMIKDAFPSILETSQKHSKSKFSIDLISNS